MYQTLFYASTRNIAAIKNYKFPALTDNIVGQTECK